MKTLSAFEMTDSSVNITSTPANEKDFSTYFDTNEFLFKEGERCDFAYIIESGSVEVFHHCGDRKLVLANLGEGDVLGEMAIIDNLPHTASAQARQATRVIAIPLDYIGEKIADTEPTIRLLLRNIIARYRDMQTRFTQVFDNIEGFDETPLPSSNADTTAEFKNVILQYQKIQQRIHSAVNMPSDRADNVPVGEQTLFTSKLLVTQDKSIKAALKDEEFLLHFQPIMDLKRKKLVGCEALVRWLNTSGNLIQPSEFIPRAEMTGLIVDLGYWIVRKACEFQRDLAQRFKQRIYVSINLSSKQFEDPLLIDSLANIMRETGARPELIKFEITESLLMDSPEIAIDALHRLKETGAKLAIDDFGTGYSSFSYLHQLPFDTLKIDRTFIAATSSNDKSNAKSNNIIKTLVHLSHDLGMDVIAEGIETKSELEMLRQVGADFGQGFLFSKGLSGDDLIKAIDRRISKKARS